MGYWACNKCGATNKDYPEICSSCGSHGFVNNPTEVHQDYCNDCPSRNYKVGSGYDITTDKFASYPDGERQRFVFPCWQRRNKLCKGICEIMGYDEKKHAHLAIEGF